ncbi:MAG: SDR family oxidoreductase [Rhodospirillales bacterium]
MGALAGRTAFVTGAARGIGFAIARRYAAEGAAVAIGDINPEGAGEAARKINDAGGKAIAVELDVSDETSGLMAVDAAVAAFGRLDILVNNAASITPTQSILELTPADWRRAIDINLTGAYLMCRAVLPAMRDRGNGVIINVASQLGSVGSKGRAPYCASKGALIQFTRVLALDHAAEGIRVVSLSPGAVVTERLLDFYDTPEGAQAALGPKHPIGRIGEPDEIAGAALFLASDDAAFMAGSDLVVDGGYIAQ